MKGLAVAENLSEQIEARRKALVAAQEQEEKSRESQEVAARRKASFIGSLASRNGISIVELGVRGFATEEARRLLAGFVASSVAKKVPAIEINHAVPYYGNALIRPFVSVSRKNLISGWLVGINTYTYLPTRCDNREIATTSVLASPDYRLYNMNASDEGGFIYEAVVRSSVVENLAVSDAIWVEPDKSTYL